MKNKNVSPLTILIRMLLYTDEITQAKRNLRNEIKTIKVNRKKLLVATM